MKFSTKKDVSNILEILTSTFMAMPMKRPRLWATMATKKPNDRNNRNLNISLGCDDMK